MAHVVDVMGASLASPQQEGVRQPKQQQQQQNAFKFDFFTEQESDQINAGIRRIREIGTFAKLSNVRLLVDAEYTYMNPGISAVALSMMVAFNQTKSVVCNTYQCYLKVDRHAEIALGTSSLPTITIQN